MKVKEANAWLLMALFSCSVTGVAAASFLDTVLDFIPRSFIDIFGSRLSPSNPLKATHLNNVSVVDHMQVGLPKLRMGHRVADLFHGWHFDDILMDSPDSIRPASVVVFYDSSNEQCMQDYNRLNFDYISERELPARSQIFTARYDMFSAPKRTWYEFTPEMDLEKRFDVKTCPEVVFTSRKCSGFTEWCTRGKDEEDERITVIGCDNFKESCPAEYRQVWKKEDGNLADWIKDKLKKDGTPKLTRFLGSYYEQGRWLQKREYTSTDNHFRNTFLAQAFPAFTHRGFKVVETPEPFQKWLLEFVETHEKFRKTEHWHAESTQMSFHEKPTTFIDMDRVRAQKERMANQYLKPLVEEWSGMKPLELTSFYGMREYHEGAWLKQHVDRIDTHVLSVTLSVAKRNFTFDPEGKFPYKPWPLQVTDWTGKQVAYDHPAGTMILYESSKLPHGRPTRNEGGIHLGCFVHYKPVNMHGSEAKKWDDITAKARKNQKDHTEWASFKATDEVEPEEPEFAEENYGEGSAWKKHGDKEADTDNSFGIELKNGADRSLSLYWYHETQAEPVFQGTVFAGSSMTLNTYHGHQFFWAEEGQKKPTALPGGKFTVDIGKQKYEYKMKKDGSINKDIEVAQKVAQWIEEDDKALGVK